MFQITHRRKKCIGCHGCVEAAPDRWAMSAADGKAVLLHGELNRRGESVILVHELEWEANERAAEACPVNIIELRMR